MPQSDDMIEFVNSLWEALSSQRNRCRVAEGKVKKVAGEGWGTGISIVYTKRRTG